MSNFQIKAHELVVSRDSKSAFADSFIFEPENIEEQALGNLYIIGEVTNFSDSSSYLINLLISIIKREYYVNPKRSPLDSLETALHKANSTLADFAEQGNIEWINNLNITIAVLKDRLLHFSQTGHCRVLLIRNGEIANISQGLAAEQVASHLKTFANIASGQLEIGDQLVLATESFFSIVSESEIKIISEMEFEEKIKGLEETIRRGRDTIDSASIIILKLCEFKESPEKLNHIEIPKELGAPVAYEEEKASKLKLEELIGGSENKNVYQEKGSQDSISKLYSERNNIDSEKIKFPEENVFKRAVKYLLKYSKIIIKEIIKYTKIVIIKFIELAKSNLIPLVKKLVVSTAALIIIFSRRIGESLCKKKELKQISSEPDAIENREIIVESHQNAEISRGVEILPKSASIAKLAPINLRTLLSFVNARNFVVFSATMMLIFTISVIVAVRGQKNEEKNIATYTSIFTVAVQKKEAAEIALIYQDENKVKSLLKEAVTALNDVYSSGYLKNESAKELSLIKSIVDKLDKVTVLSEDKILSDLSTLDKNIDVDRMVLIDSAIYSFGSSRNVIYAYDTTEGTLKQVNVDSANVGHFKLVTATEDKKIILYHDTPGVAIYDPKKNELRPVEISLPSGNTAIKGIATFGSSLYILDAQEEQVVKYTRTISGFGDGKNWISKKGEKNLAKSVSLAIDGAIYILDSEGNIDKYFSGEVKDFGVFSLFYPIINSKKIITKPSFKNLYVLDPANKRIVIFDKTGKLVKQIEDDKFGSLKDAVILDGEKEAYVLKGTAIYKIGL